ncbi:MAG: hypothetical protein IJ413_09445 [Bacteroides sp.]|nr:hypothetical protein [Bacteroides sp.]MBQ8602741.1 hypothetical protein [Bacteroides sp.]
MRRFHLDICTLFTSAVFMVACADDQIIEQDFNLTPSKSICFDAKVEWPGEDYIDSRSASASMKRIGNHLLQSDDDSEPLPMGVYVQDGIHPTYANEPESRGAVLTQDGITSFNVWATLNKADNVGGGSIEYFSGVAFDKEGEDNLFSSTKEYYCRAKVLHLSL